MCSCEFVDAMIRAACPYCCASAEEWECAVFGCLVLSGFGHMCMSHDMRVSAPSVRSDGRAACKVHFSDATPSPFGCLHTNRICASHCGRETACWGVLTSGPLQQLCTALEGCGECQVACAFCTFLECFRLGDAADCQLPTGWGCCVCNDGGV